MSIIYIISTIIFFISSLFIKKSDEKLDLTTWISISVILLLSYNTFICYLMTMIHISINLYTLTIINLICSLIMNLFIMKNNRQFYCFRTKDLISIGLVLAITLIFAYMNFGFPFEIKYIMTDSGVHYHATNIFYQTNSLMKEHMMPGAYSNAGILMKIFSSYMEFIDLYKVFIGFDIFMFFMTGILMFVALKKIIKSNYDIIISTIITIIYMIGYPLNVMLFGYFYLQLGILIFSTIIIIMQYFKEEKLHTHSFILTLFLLCFEIFFSYYLFVPAIYLALFIYYAYMFYKKSHKIINKDLILYTAMTLMIPAVLGFVYHILPGIHNINNIESIRLMSMEGYIYRNVYSNILLFIPFVIIYFIRNQKEFNFNMIILICLIVYMCFLYLGCIYKFVSTYYFYKTYFILWFIILYLFGIELIDIARTNITCKKFANIFIYFYIVILYVSLMCNNVFITKDTHTHETILDVMDIYGINKTILFFLEKDYTAQEIEILKYFKNNVEISENTEILILGEPKQEFWFWGFLNYRNRENPEIPIKDIDIEEWNENKKYDYLIYFNRSNTFKKEKDKINLNKKIIYTNKSGGILQN